MAQRGVAPDVKSFNAMARGLVLEGRTTDAADLVSELPSGGLQLDIFTFNALIKGYCRDGNLGSAKKKLDELPESGFPPNRETYQTLFPLLYQSGELALALRLCSECTARNRFVVERDVAESDRRNSLRPLWQGQPGGRRGGQ